MSGRRFSRAFPPVVGQRVMSREGSYPMTVVGIGDVGTLRACVAYRSVTERWFDFSALYDATDLLSWHEAGFYLTAEGAKVDYVIPGSVAFAVVRLYRDGDGRWCAALSNGTNVWMKPDAPRFRRVA